MTPAERSVVEAPAGAMAGRVVRNGVRFSGLPYADAPVGKRRFQSPLPRARFESLFDATRPGATPQRVPLRGPATMEEPSVAGTDILNVTIDTPDGSAPGDDRPVLVWVHGGSYRGGSPLAPSADPTFFSQAGIITVRVAYRLGFDGFGEIAGADENRGLTDILMALRWVHENIRSFGGHPRRVTLGGVSAGASLVLSMLSSGHTEGLIDRAWCLSPTLFDTGLTDAHAVAAELTRSLRVSATVEGLLAAGDDEFLQRHFRELHPLIGDVIPSGIDGPTTVVPLTPLSGGVLLPHGTAAGLSLPAADVPLLVSATADEVDAFGVVPTMPPDSPSSRQLLETWRVTGRNQDPYLNRVTEAGLSSLVSDSLFRSVPLAIADLRKRNQSRTWLAEFAVRDAAGRASHADDVASWFGLAAASPDRGHIQPAASQRAHHTAVDFIKGSDPSWPADGQHSYVFADADVVSERPFDRAEPLRGLWAVSDPAFAWRSTPSHT
jgi:para-nitrobenzyl esterase